MADALLSHEVLDADQVRRIAAGLPIDAPQPASPRMPVSGEDESPRPRLKERPSIVPALNKPIPQE